MSNDPVVVIGAGPVGLAAAAHLEERNFEVVVLEKGPRTGANVEDWGHVRLFSPWSTVIDQAAARRLQPTGWGPPDANSYPTGEDLLVEYLWPLSRTFGSTIRTNTTALAVARERHDKVRSDHRADRPFVVRVCDTDGISEITTRAVIDASGTWHNPNPAGSNGLLAHGEDLAPVAYGIPDILGKDRDRYVGRRVAVIGGGHTAANALIWLTELAAEHPGTWPMWIIRRDAPTTVYGVEDDQLAERSALGRRLAGLVEQGDIDLVPNFAVASFDHQGDGWTVCDIGCRRPVLADTFIVATGQRPDLHLTRELRIGLDAWLEAPVGLAPLIDPNVHTCGTVSPHGAAELSHPELDFYTVGVKSYGRAPTFLLATGYEQVRSVVAKLAGDDEAAARVELELPGNSLCGPNGC